MPIPFVSLQKSHALQRCGEREVVPDPRANSADSSPASRLARESRSGSINCSHAMSHMGGTRTRRTRTTARRWSAPSRILRPTGRRDGATRWGDRLDAPYLTEVVTPRPVAPTRSSPRLDVRPCPPHRQITASRLSSGFSTPSVVPPSTPHLDVSPRSARRSIRRGSPADDEALLPPVRRQRVLRDDRLQRAADGGAAGAPVRSTSRSGPRSGPVDSRPPLVVHRKPRSIRWPL